MRGMDKEQKNHKLNRIENQLTNRIGKMKPASVTDGDSQPYDWPVQGRMNYPLLFSRPGEPKPALCAVLNTPAKTVSSAR